MTRSSPTSSTTPRSSTASGSRRRARYRYRNRDMADLEAQLVAASDARRRVIVTDGVFSMDGYIAPLPRSATSPTSTTRSCSSTTRTPSASSARTGAARPSTAASRAASTSRPARSARRSAGHPAATSRPARRSSTCCASAPARTSSRTRSRRRSSRARCRRSSLLSESGSLRETLRANAALFRSLMEAEGFELLPGEHPIVPVMFGDAAVTARVAAALQERGVLRHGVQLPGGAAGCGAHPGAAVGGALRGRDPALRGGVRGGPRRGGGRGLSATPEHPLDVDETAETRPPRKAGGRVSAESGSARIDSA